MTMPWLAELTSGWETARAAFAARGGGEAAALVAAYLGLDLAEPLDARIAGHCLHSLQLTRGRIKPGVRAPVFSWPLEGEGGAACWLYPLYDGAAELIEVLAFDVEGRTETDIFSYGESLAHVGLDAWPFPDGPDRRLVMIARPRAWLRYWIDALRKRDSARVWLHGRSPMDCAALIVRPHAIDFTPVRRTRPDWIEGVDEVVVMGAELSERVGAAFRAAATNAVPELKVAGTKGG
jgi:hypothetical protein